MHLFEEHRIAAGLESLDVRTYNTHQALTTAECNLILDKNRKTLNRLQQKLYGQARQSLLIVFQAMDAAGKDSTIRKVFSGMNPQGFLVSNFKTPSSRELGHDYLWRISRQLPSRGRIGIFNRSHYEEVLACRVHPQYITYQNLPKVHTIDEIKPDFWSKRFRQINDFERYLSENGTRIIKFFLNVSKEEQEKRFYRRMDLPEKHWKFSLGDLTDRAKWEEYMDAYSEAIKETSKEHAPWFIIPADDKDYMRAAVSDIVTFTMKEMDLSYPEITERQIQDIAKARELLKQEKN